GPLADDAVEDRQGALARGGRQFDAGVRVGGDRAGHRGGRHGQGRGQGNKQLLHREGPLLSGGMRGGQWAQRRKHRPEDGPGNLLKSRPVRPTALGPMNTLSEHVTPQLDADERIVAALLEKGRLKEADVGRARRLQEETGGSLLALLGRLGLVSERDHAEACAEVLGLPLASAKDLPELPPEGTPLTVRFMTQFHVVPVAEDEAAVDVLAADPQDAYALDAVRLATGKAVRASVALRSEVADLIERWHGQGRSAMGA